ncbi:glutathione S-transferase N-terminal domain-containing protein [Sphingorhabdus sp. Alg231-15]|uniref:glutathione S-transferase N-terminal domain-containing protein n=1 Tax=Sphingorhabdus sp. Alg231-15 TaxID=1922222 RepID=UPI000D553659
MTTPHILYGMAGSLYTGKVRAYMRQNHIPFVEHKAGSRRFTEQIVPKVGRWIIPVVETPEGELIQDGTVILDHFEANGASVKSIYPQTPVMRAVAHLFELFGGEGLLRPAMHYRWNFDDVNLPFIRDVFRDVLPNGLDPEAQKAVFDHASGRMRKAAVAFGVTPETFTTVEESYADFLGRYNAHLQQTPFLLGGHATIGDFGLFGPLYPHLARDPKPLHLMQTTAPRVFRWTERMNMPEIFIDEEAERVGDKLFADDEISDTLKSLMYFVAEEYLGEITAHVEFANDWLEKNSEVDPSKMRLGRGIGMTSFNWRGHEITTAVMPYRFFLLQRLTDWIEGLDGPDQQSVRALFAETGLEPILDLKTSRRVERKNHLEVWAD